MSGKDQKFSEADKIVTKFEKRLKNPKTKGFNELYVGVDLGTACITVVVLDEKKEPIAGVMKWDSVVRDGMVVDYIGAIDSLKEIKAYLEKKLGVELIYASCAIPSGTENLNHGVIQNVIEGAGFINVETFDESIAANSILKIDNGAIVDIGGGTTGISIIEDNKVIYVADEPTGGTHFSLVIAGAMDMNYEDAELYKRDNKNHEILKPVVRPVIDKISTIIDKHISGKKVNEIYLVGGSSCFNGIEDVIESNLGIKTIKPKNPLFITPIGIAISSPVSTKVKGDNNDKV